MLVAQKTMITRFTSLLLAALWVCGSLVLPALGGCAAQAETQGPEIRGKTATTSLPLRGTVADPRKPDPETLPHGWAALGLRLQEDGLYGIDLDDALRALPPPTQDPMDRKIQELYGNAFPRPTPPATPGTKPREPMYINPKVVNEANAELCRAYLKLHETAFERAEANYGVPRDIAVALLFNETRLGEYVGVHDVFYTLASMSTARDPAQIPDWLAKLDGPEEREAWIRERMEQRSDWAYKELTAYIRYVRAHHFHLLSVPGSVFGALGLCQFMPSNIVPYGVDGNGDGVVNLFDVDDAIASLSHYLVKHGWKPGLSRAQQHAVLKRYNSLNIYANNILSLADLVRGDPVGQPVIPAKKTAARKK